MEVEKIVEGMTAVQVAEAIDRNFKNQNKILEEDIAKQNNVIGVSEYKDFSEAEAVNVGDVRKYNGLLYECVEATTGAFDASKWKKSSFKAETEKKLSELGSEAGMRGVVITDGSSTMAQTAINVDWEAGKTYRFIAYTTNKNVEGTILIGGTMAAGVKGLVYTSDELLKGVSGTFTPTSSYKNGRVYVDSANFTVGADVYVSLISADAIANITYDILNENINAKWYVSDPNTPPEFLNEHAVRFYPKVMKKGYNGDKTDFVDLYDLIKALDSKYFLTFNDEERSVVFDTGSESNNNGIFIYKSILTGEYGVSFSVYNLPSYCVLILYICSTDSGLYFLGKASEQWTSWYNNRFCLNRDYKIEPYYGGVPTLSYNGNDIVIERGFSLYYKGERFDCDNYQSPTREYRMTPSYTRSYFYLNADKFISLGDKESRWNNLMSCIEEYDKKTSTNPSEVLLAGFYLNNILPVGEFGKMINGDNVKSHIKKNTWISVFKKNELIAPSIIDKFQVVAGHQYFVFIKSNSLLNENPLAKIKLGLSLNGIFEGTTAQSIYDGVLLEMVAIESASVDNGRVYMDLLESNGDIEGVSVDVSIYDMTDYTSIVNDSGDSRAFSIEDGISYNITASTGGEYTIDDLLTRANELIPFKYQLGGAAIKFVDSKSHRYVTYVNNHKEWTTDREYWSIIGTSGESLDFKSVEEKIIQFAAPSNKMNWAGNNIKPLVMLHFSDMHSDRDRYDRIVAYKKKFAQYIDDAIHTGDGVKMYYSDDFSYWTDNSILNCIGNHETCVNNSTIEGWYGRTALESYNQFFKPYIDNWGVVKPEYSSTDGACYYYKDYELQGIRLIVLDGMHYDDKQNSWLSNIMNDSLTNNKHIVIASHFIPAKTINNTESLYDTIDPTNKWENDWPGYGLLDPRVPIMVDEYLKNGGDFICYISGHVHNNIFRPLFEYPSQYVIGVDTAACEGWANSFAGRHIANTTTQDNFNMLSFDVATKRLKLIKVASSYDRHMVLFNSMLWDWGQRKILFQG